MGLSMNVDIYRTQQVNNNDTYLLNNLLKVYNKLSPEYINIDNSEISEDIFSDIKEEYSYTDETMLTEAVYDPIITTISEAN
jgi:predicted unusual protein kinase regulating ubiquinone biosynthesis (AarF/ABC1/UbiB family)